MAGDVLLGLCLFILAALIAAMIRVAAIDAARERSRRSDVTELLQRALYKRRAERLGLLGTGTNRRARNQANQ